MSALFQKLNWIIGYWIPIDQTKFDYFIHNAPDILSERVPKEVSVITIFYKFKISCIKYL